MRDPISYLLADIDLVTAAPDPHVLGGDGTGPFDQICAANCCLTNRQHDL